MAPKRRRTPIETDPVAVTVLDAVEQRAPYASEAKKRKQRPGSAAAETERDVELTQQPEGQREQTTGKKRKLGSWFPKASLIKGEAFSSDATISLLLFYQYVEPEWDEARKDEAIAFVERSGARLNLGGRVRVAQEGINATISSTPEACREFAAALHQFDKAFEATDFKFIDDLPADRAFKDLRVLPVRELVFYDIEGSLGEGGQHLEPEEYRAKLQEPDAVVIDVRNAYETEIGRFQGQEADGGARYLDPQMRKSTDFQSWLARDEVKEELKGKSVLMYCTGGVRCERASALVKREIGDEVNGVFQLQGGVEKYLQTFPDGGGQWQGKNFVFDKREAFGAGAPEGVGGVVTKAKGKSKETKDDVLGKCCVCAVPWDRYIGKKKCATCRVPVLVCEACCTKRVDKDPTDPLRVRCPLCKSEGVDLLASQVHLTANGVRATKADDASEGKAAPTIFALAGQGAKRKQQRQQRKRSAMTCKFGSRCTRADCWFAHPDGKAAAVPTRTAS